MKRSVCGSAVVGWVRRKAAHDIGLNSDTLFNTISTNLKRKLFSLFPNHSPAGCLPSLDEDEMVASYHHN